MRQGLIDAIYEVYSDHDGDGSDEVEDYADAVVLYVAGWLRDGYEQGGTVYEEAERIARDWEKEHKE
jgi:hypothetical protein